ncbi:hypothetical protein BJI67_16475 (plasmid) [Acidihalobacter aeolianus]|uniref:Uncharacterized protein n=1 Tax=Acidihalobacter aeolianus TaxID=2792603 RepID=A0A1D8KD00_9GAMM|nr:DUF1870 family protein [Acidihalobacter aeolianus]AOV18833.1 hypothetical protein BJI67_16475 [Acidihalobacter aeolianus]
MSLELEMKRRLLQFNPPEAAAAAKIRRADTGEIRSYTEQAWRRYEQGIRVTPPEIMTWIDSVLAWRDEMIDIWTTRLTSLPCNERHQFIWYELAKDWASLPDNDPSLWRPYQSVYLELMLRYPDKVKFVRYSDSDYRSWLGRRKDTDSMRFEWACTKEA